MPPDPTTSPVRFATIDRFEGYGFDSDGGVWSSWQQVCKGHGGGTYSALGDYWRRIKPVVHRNGYQRIILANRSGPRKLHLVHRLILESFVGPCPVGMECRHLDGDRGNNKLDNLAWGSRVENESDKLDHGTRRCGERMHTSKLTESQVIQIREARVRGEILSEIARRFGIDQSNVSMICRRKTWRHLA
jgi:hypothetical protein